MRPSVVLCATIISISNAALIHSGTPDGIPEKTDCALRQFAWEYGKKLKPDRGEFRTLFDALQLGACGVPEPSTNDEFRPPSRHPDLPQNAMVLHVDPKPGDDDDLAAQSGLAPLRSISAAVKASRNRTADTPAHVVLHGGVHYLTETIELTALDSRLTIRNAEKESATVSGGVNLTTNWVESSR